MGAEEFDGEMCESFDGSGVLFFRGIWTSHSDPGSDDQYYIFKLRYGRTEALVAILPRTLWLESRMPASAYG